MACTKADRVTKEAAGGKTENFVIVTYCMQIAKQLKKSSNHKVGNGRFGGIGLAFLFFVLAGTSLFTSTLAGHRTDLFGLMCDSKNNGVSAFGLHRAELTDESRFKFFV